MPNNFISKNTFALKPSATNRNNIAPIPYLMFSYVGISVISLGSMKLELANHFGIDTSKLQYLLTMFSAAVTFMVMVNKFLIKKIPIKTNLILASFLIILGTIGMTTAKTIAIFSVYLTTT